MSDTNETSFVYIEGKKDFIDYDDYIALRWGKGKDSYGISMFIYEDSTDTRSCLFLGKKEAEKLMKTLNELMEKFV